MPLGFGWTYGTPQVTPCSSLRSIYANAKEDNNVE
jgi:hypothetical protein